MRNCWRPQPSNKSTKWVHNEHICILWLMLHLNSLLDPLTYNIGLLTPDVGTYLSAFWHQSHQKLICAAEIFPPDGGKCSMMVLPQCEYNAALLHLTTAIVSSPCVWRRSYLDSSLFWLTSLKSKSTFLHCFIAKRITNTHAHIPASVYVHCACKTVLFLNESTK